MLIEIINYGLNSHELLLSPDKIPSLDEKQFKKYRKHMEKSNEFTPNFSDYSAKVWHAFSHSHPAYQSEFFGKQFWAAMDAKNHDTFGSLIHVMFHDDNENYTDAITAYVEDVLKEFHTALIAKDPTTDTEHQVLDSIHAKLQWYLFDHRWYHYAPIMPLMTPSIIVHISAVLASVPRALLEVSSVHSHSQITLIIITLVPFLDFPNGIP